MLLLLLSLLSRGVSAQQVPIIESGREHEIVALFRPHQLGGEVVPGWRLMNIRVQPTYIEVEVEGSDRSAFFRLDHPEASRHHSDSTKSFAISRGENATEGDAARAVTLLIEALRKNDAGEFWRERRAVASPQAVEQRSRGVWVPVIATGVVLAVVVGAVLVARRRKRRG